MSLAKSPASLLFKVHRLTPELVTPAKPTPHEFKPLSDFDTRYVSRPHEPVILFYPPNPSMSSVEPVQVIKKALAAALVYYYPFAGRLREGPSGKLIVECTGEGVLFTEAHADVSLDQFGYPLAPPFPGFDQLLFDVPGSTDILNSPLQLIQVTRLKCGGLIFGIRNNHIIGDAFGLRQFMFAIGEIARGATSPPVLPIWGERHLLSFENLQLTSPTPQHNEEIIETRNNLKVLPENELCYRTFFFEPADILALRRQIPPHFPRYSSFKIVNSCVWKCRVLALQPHPTDEVSLIWPVNLRNGKHKHLLLQGYYGNAIVIAMAMSTAKEITENPLSYTLELMRNAEPKMSKDYDRYVASRMVNMRGYKVSDLRYAGFDKVNFGWGEPLFAGPSRCSPVSGFQMPFKTKNGENGVMLPMCLPKQVMERFEKELKTMLNDKTFSGNGNVAPSKL